MPESERTKAASRLVRELTPDTLETKVKAAISAGRSTGLFAKAMLDYSEGNALAAHLKKGQRRSIYPFGVFFG